jgi:hypothetical protein
VTVSFAGPIARLGGADTVEATVLLASENGRSLMLSFEAMIGSPGAGAYVGMMPILWEEERGEFTDLIQARPVKISRRD